MMKLLLEAFILISTLSGCRASVDCNGTVGDDLGQMTPRQCCVDTPNGLAYSSPGDTMSCTPCIVFGFLQDSFTGIEQGPGHMVEVGYQKGAAIAEVNLVLSVQSMPGTAREGAGFDYTVNTNQARLLYQSPDQRESVVFTFRVDSIAQEANETLSLRLVPRPTTPLPVRTHFFRDTLDMVIIDTDTVAITFSEDDFRANEFDPLNRFSLTPVLVTKNSRIANRIELDVVPLTVQQAQDSTPPVLLDNIPTNNPFSPPYADLRDFNNTVIRVIFEEDESASINDMRTPVPIFDDLINEATEQVFVVQLKLISSTNPGGIDLAQRPASLCRIVDNDQIRIGFELPSYTFLEPEFEEIIDQFYVPESGLAVNGPVYLTKEDNVTTEQTFVVLIQISEVPPDRNIETATPNEDYAANAVSMIPFPPTDQKLVFQFTLLADSNPEDTEAFQVSSTRGGQSGTPMFSGPITLFAQTIIVIEDDDVVPIVIGFEQTQYNINESVGTVEVFVSVSMPIGGQMLVGGVNLVIQTVAGSAGYPYSRMKLIEKPYFEEVSGQDYVEINAQLLDPYLMFTDTDRRLSFNVTINDDSQSETSEDFSIELRFDPFDAVSGSVTLSPNVSTITIEDDDVAAGLNISFEKETYTVDEGDGYVEVCFSTDTGHAQRIEVTITPVRKMVENPALPGGSDFDETPTMHTFVASPTGDVLCTNITIFEDSVYEGDEQFLVTFGNLPNSQAGVGRINQSCITIRDNDIPQFNIGPTISVNESTPEVKICISSNVSLESSIAVTAVTGPKRGAENQAIADLDYNSTTVMLNFDMPNDTEETTMCFSVPIIDDLLGNEPNEEFSVFITNIVPAGSVISNAEACITIIDNDTPEVEWERPQITIPEGQNETICFTTNIGTATPYDVVIDTRQTGPNPASSNDYSIPQASLMITIPESENGSVFCIDLYIVDDTIIENDEQLELIFRNLPSEFATVGDIDTVNVTILDNDDGRPRVSFERETYIVDEGAGYVEVCFLTNIGHPQSINVMITPVMKGVDYPAASDSDFDATPTMKIFEASPTGDVLCVNITLYDDFVYEGDEQFLVMFGNLPNSQAGVGRINQSCVTIRDDDEPEFQIGPTTSVNETTPYAEICISTNTTLDRNVSVTVSTGRKIGATNQATAFFDYIPAVTVLTFIPQDEGTQRKCFNVSIVDDLLGNEPDEEFSVAITNAVPAGRAVSSAEACITIIDNDTPEIEWERSDITIPEGENETICFTTNIGTATPYDVVIDTRQTGPNPASSDDYSIPQASLMITVPESENGSVFCIDLYIVDDAITENDEEFELIFRNLPSEFATVGDIDTVNVTILDDDDGRPRVSFERETYIVDEGAGYVEVCFLTNIGHPQSINVMITPVMKGVDYPAASDSDFDATPTTKIFEASPIGDVLCVNITIHEDSVYEGDEQFLVTFGNLPNSQAGVGRINQSCITIRDDDEPEFQIGPTTSVNESTPYVEICVSTNSTLDRNISVTVTTGLKIGATNQATAILDYTPTAVALTFIPQDEGTQGDCFTVSIIDDLLGNEPDEEFSVTITNAVPAGRVAGSAEACITIIDNDTPEIEWERSDITILEGENETICFTTNIGTATPYDVVIDSRQTGPNPASSDDYSIPQASLMITVPESENGSVFCIDLYIIDDTITENDEQFELIFRNLPSEFATVGDIDTVNVTILDDDVGRPRVSFERETYFVDERAGYVEVCFLTSIGHPQSIDVMITPVMKGVDYPAASDSDFDASPRMKTFEASPSGDVLCVNITIYEDFVYEGNEQFLVTFGNLPNSQAGVGRINQSCITIRDDDEPEFQIGPTTSVNESTPYVEICISTNSTLDRNVSVTVATGSKIGATNEATAVLDYIPAVTVLTFIPQDEGTQRKCFNVSIIDDLLGNEPDEEFSVTITNAVPAGRAVGSAQACITIIDNDTPEIEWKRSDITIPEGENETICFTTNIGTATPYDIMIGTNQKSLNPASSDDYSLFETAMFTVPVSGNGSVFCIDVLARQDTVFENEEQLELNFQNLPSQYATVGDNATVCITITDDDDEPTSPPPPTDVMTCRINEPLRVQPFTRTSMFGFMGTCEHIATSFCETIPGFDVRVTVDFLTQSMENGAVGLHVNDLRYVSREDGSFDDGGQTPVSSTTTSREYTATSFSRVFVSFDQEMTNITLNFNSSTLDIFHVYSESNPSIQINIQTPNDSSISNFCGLCGSRFGDLLLRNGMMANILNMTEVQAFAQSYLVEPRDQILRPQRKECGTIRNDTVIGDPLYAAPVYSEDGKEYNLCYEVYGRANATFNLVSDTCVSVNAFYGAMDNPVDGNIIRSVGVRAKGMSANSCHNIRVDLEGCSATVETPSGDSQLLASMERFEQDGISVRKYPSRVRISAPNCENVMLVMWVVCERRNNGQEMIKFVIARGVNLRASSHGLLGQFWNIPVTFVKYTGNFTNLPEDLLEERDKFYIVTVEPVPSPNRSSPPRSFLGFFYTQKWDHSSGPCLYVGNAQGGPSSEVLDPNDSVIEGDYLDYRIQDGDLFETSYKYAQFEEERCQA